MPYVEYAQIMPNLQTLTPNFTIAMNQTQIVSELGELDMAREKMLRSLNKILKGYADLGVPQVSEPARRRLTTFNKYGLEITKYRYDAESGNITSMLKTAGTSHKKEISYFAKIILSG